MLQESQKNLVYGSAVEGGSAMRFIGRSKFESVEFTNRAEPRERRGYSFVSLFFSLCHVFMSGGLKEVVR